MIMIRCQVVDFTFANDCFADPVFVVLIILLRSVPGVLGRACVREREPANGKKERQREREP